MKPLKILVLLPFAAKGSLATAVALGLEGRGFVMSAAFCAAPPAIYERESRGVFQSDERLMDLSSKSEAERLEAIKGFVVENQIDVILQFGAANLYRILPYVKESSPGIRLVDVLFNQLVYAQEHFLVEDAFDGILVESQFMFDFIKRSSPKAAGKIEFVAKARSRESNDRPVLIDSYATAISRLAA
ncbi:hypothetical protein ACQ858_19485 [Variovorax ureilyticus]|uniref:hypothetical protein n=1 Tax=Variovorax ureilyticus TaxID=1836198 RepID=UPI003D67582F